MPLRYSRSTVSSALLALSCCTAMPAFADDFSVAQVPMIAGQSCAGIDPDSGKDLPGDLTNDDGKWRIVGRERLAFYIVAFGREVLGPEQALDRLGGANPTPGSPDRVNSTLRQFQDKLASGNLDGILAFASDGKPIKSGQVDRNTVWLKDPGITIRCLLPRPQPKATKSISWRLRGNVDALAAEGKARLKADAASFGYSRTRTFQDDGSRTQADEITVDAVLGAKLGSRPGLNFTGFVGYQLKQNRASPAPTLNPPATERDGDTDVLTLGILADSIIDLGGKNNEFGSSIRLSASGSYLFDFVKDSERIKGEVTVNLYHRSRSNIDDEQPVQPRKPLLGLCDIGGLTDLGGGVWTQCGVQGIVTFNQVTRHGTLVPADDDHFGHIGGKVSATLYLGDPGKESSFFASGEYTYLRRFDGNATAIPHIRRHSFKIGHRWWQGKAFALEVKGELSDGINPDSFADENALTLGFGVIF